jgi:hypothetical protein
MAILAFISSQIFVQMLPMTLSQGIKQHQRDAGYSPTSCAKVKNVLCTTSTSLPICFHGVVFEQTESFTLSALFPLLPVYLELK